MAQLGEVSISEYVRFAVLWYTQQIIERAENMTTTGAQLVDQVGEVADATTWAINELLRDG